MSATAAPVHTNPLLRNLRLVPGLVAGAFAFGVLIWSGAGLWSIVVYVVGFLWQVVLPGVILYRALSGRSRMLAVELGAGSATGLIFQLVGWLVFVGLGIGQWIVLWPLAVVVPFALIPRLREHLRPKRYAELMHPVTAWGIAGCLALLTAWFIPLFSRSILPPGANQWYEDQYYHLSLSGMFLHQVVPMTPQVAGQPLTYHWFVHAHLAGMALTTGLELPLVLTRLWILPIVAVVLFLFVAIMHELTGTAWPAVVAAALTTLGGSIRTAAWYGFPGTEPFAVNSPSQDYSLAFMLLAILLLLRLLRRGLLGLGEWTLLALVLLLAQGTKSSTLPLLICGLTLAVAIGLLQRRGFRPAVWGLGAALVAFATTSRVIGGGSAGVGMQFSGTIRRNPVWAAFVGITPLEQRFPTSSHLLPGLSQAGAPLLLALLVLASAVMYAWLVPGALLLRRRHGTAGWFLLGIGIAGWVAMMVIDHAGMSQLYFMDQALLAWHILAAWGVWELVTIARTHLSGKVLWGLVVTFGLLGWGAVAVLLRWGPRIPARSNYLAAIAVPLLVVVIAIAFGLGGAFALRRSGRRAAAAALAVALMSGLLGAALLPFVSGHLTVTQSSVLGAEQVTAGETLAALWLRDNAPPREVVATNVHCRSVRQAPHCDARAFWVSGFSEHPVLIEGWGYTEQATLMDGRDGYGSIGQPFFDQSLFDLNQRAFTEPSDEVMLQLAKRGVKWLFADLYRGPISSLIGSYAQEVWRNGDVVIYRLR